MKPIRFGQKARPLPGTPRSTDKRKEAQGKAAWEALERKRREGRKAP